MVKNLLEFGSRFVPLTCRQIGLRPYIHSIEVAGIVENAWRYSELMGQRSLEQFDCPGRLAVFQSKDRPESWHIAKSDHRVVWETICQINCECPRPGIVPSKSQGKGSSIFHIPVL